MIKEEMMLQLKPGRHKMREIMKLLVMKIEEDKLK